MGIEARIAGRDRTSRIARSLCDNSCPPGGENGRSVTLGSGQLGGLALLRGGGVERISGSI